MGGLSSFIGSLFGVPKAQGAPAAPTPTPAAPLPPDPSDALVQNTNLRKFAQQQQTSGVGANQLTESRLGDYSAAATRSGALPPSQIIRGS